MSNPVDRAEFAPLPLDDATNLLVQEFVAWLYSANPFWAAMLSGASLRLGFVPPALEAHITTAATDGYTTIWLNRGFLYHDVLPKADRAGVSRAGAIGYILLHEVAHILADHTSDHHVANMPNKMAAAMAVDYQVFDMLAKDAFLPPAALFDPCPVDRAHAGNKRPDATKVQFFGDANLGNVVPDSDDVLKIYEYLLRQSAGGGKPSAGALHGDVQPENSPGHGDGDGDGDDGDGEGSTGPTNAVTQRNPGDQVREQLIAEAVITAKTIGNMSHAASRMADALTKSKTPWQRMLVNLMSAAASRAQDRKRSYRRLGRRTDATTPDYIIKPGRIRDPKPGVLLVADCSGSISDNELRKFAGECEGVLASGKVGYISVIYCDTQVEDRGEKFLPRQKVTLKPSSSGGTDFEPVWHHQRKHYPDVAAIVYLTDLYGSFGDKKSWPKIPVIWGATTEIHPPFGKAVRIGAA